MTASEFIKANAFETNEDMMIAFAKYHLEQALENVYHEVRVYPVVYSNSLSFLKKEEVLDWYPLNDIK